MASGKKQRITMPKKGINFNRFLRRIFIKNSMHLKAFIEYGYSEKIGYANLIIFKNGP